jgi:hypothetical protein
MNAFVAQVICLELVSSFVAHIIMDDDHCIGWLGIPPKQRPEHHSSETSPASCTKV